MISRFFNKYFFVYLEVSDPMIFPSCLFMPFNSLSMISWSMLSLNAWHKVGVRSLKMMVSTCQTGFNLWHHFGVTCMNLFNHHITLICLLIALLQLLLSFSILHWDVISSLKLNYWEYGFMGATDFFLIELTVMTVE